MDALNFSTSCRRLKLMWWDITFEDITFDFKIMSRLHFEDVIFDFTQDGHHVARCPETTFLNNIEEEFRHLESTG